MLSICLSMLENPNDKPRFEEFYKKFYKVAYYVAMQHFHHHETAEDCAQEIMMKFARDFHNIKQDFNDIHFVNYVRLVSKCITIDIYRKEKKHIDNVADADLSEFFDLSTDSCELEVCDKMFLKSAVNAIPESYRYVFCLKYIYGLSGEEIARVTGISHTYVRQKCMIAMRYAKKFKEEAEKND